MTYRYAKILAAMYNVPRGNTMQDEVELAYTVIDVLRKSKDVTKPWEDLRRRADGLIKTRARRSLIAFKKSYVAAIEASGLLGHKEEPGPLFKDVSDREALFEFRLLNPENLRKETVGIGLCSIDPGSEETIIQDEVPNYKEREDEFEHRINNPGSLRRRD